MTDLNGKAQRGELTCLLGRNGTGKSTLLYTIAGLLPALQGTVVVEDKAIDKLSSQERARLMSVVLTQRPENFNVTVSELVALGRSPYTGFWGSLRAEDQRAVAEALDVVGITALARRRFNRLSDGERQKVMISRALAQQTPVILLDEPTAFLDHPAKVETFQLLSRMAHSLQKTILLSTHDVEIALEVAGSLWVLNNGLNCGKRDELDLGDVI